MPKAKNLTGKRFDRLTVLDHAGIDKRRHHTWLCKCDCGNKVTVRACNLTSGNTMSCGCLKMADASYEVWVNGEKVSTKYGLDQYTCLKLIREELAEKLLTNPFFEVYKVVKSKFPPITEAIIPYKEKAEIPVVQMDRPQAIYSNSSPYKIAR